jgi:hypothetical protein
MHAPTVSLPFKTTPSPSSHRLSFNIEETFILSEDNILVPPGWKLHHGWRIFAGGMVVPPSSAGADIYR